MLKYVDIGFYLTKSSPLNINALTASMYQSIGWGTVTWYIIRLGLVVFS